ncbi:MAG: lipoprotein signal peptidase [Gammaproteobacteria bacterium]|nr:lipoprotein signal peptidase [Gammaproteobacteria bacterium]
MKLIKNYCQSGLAWIWVTAIVLIMDRCSKLWVLNHLTYQLPLKVLPFLNFTLTFNSGVAFSFFHSASGWQNFVFGGLAILVSFIIIYWLSALAKRDWWISIALSLILGGALGNAWDRILYRYVIDFLDFHLNDWHFAIFNLADSAICIGAFMLFCYWIFEKK